MRGSPDDCLSVGAGDLEDAAERAGSNLERARGELKAILERGR